ncbi:MAG: sulfatase [Anaerolineae bacterium]|nr:sulfatase [Anaerolineae bacterium]
MKAIMVMFDSLNRHFLPPYGADGIHAPNFARLAARSVTFDNCYVGSMPCMPARRDLHTGRYNFLHRSWGPLEPFDDSMPAILNDNGIYTHLVSDHYHYWEDGGATYHTRYTSWEISRGQEGDPWKGQVKDPDIPPSLTQSRVGHPQWRQDWVNRGYLDAEEKMPQRKTFDLGMEFIRTNHAEDNWFLQIETFDPHEPFFTQQQYKDLYPHEHDGPHFDWPDYAPVKEDPLEVQHMRFEYAALVSMCDAYLGKVLDLMDEYDLWDDTLLIVNTDHGFLLGEHDFWAKNVMPWYNQLANIPLFIWDPRSQCQGERCDSLVTTIDLPATLLDFFGVERPPAMRGLPLRDAVAHNAPVHDALLFGHMGGHVNCTDGRYVYMRAPGSPDNRPLYNYTLMPTHMNRRFAVEELQDIRLADPFNFTKGCRTMQIAAQTGPFHRFETMLFDVASDPQQTRPLHDTAVERRMIGLMERLMREHSAPPEQWTRLGLPEPVLDA